MKKFTAILLLSLLSSSVFALVGKNAIFVPPKNNEQGNLELIVNKHNVVLNKWIKSNHIVGVKISTEKEVRSLPNFPKEFEKFRIRILSHNGIATMDYSPERLNVLLDENKKISSITIG